MSLANQLNRVNISPVEMDQLRQRIADLEAVVERQHRELNDLEPMNVLLRLTMEGRERAERRCADLEAAIAKLVQACRMALSAIQTNHPTWWYDLRVLLRDVLAEAAKVNTVPSKE